MKIDQLSYFIETAKLEHIGQAAKKLGISPSAISHSISKLEEEFGQKLFEKKGKNIFLTSHGQLLLEKSEKIFRDFAGLKEEMVSENIDLRGHFRLAATHVLSDKLLVPSWEIVKNKNDELTCELFTLRSAEVCKEILTGVLDLGLCFSPLNHPDIDYEHLYDGELQIVVREGHPLTKISPNKRAVLLKDYPAILPKSFQGIEVCEMHPMFKELGIVPKIDYQIDSFNIALEIVQRNLGWSLVPDWVLRQQKKITPLKLTASWDAPCHITAVWHRKRILPRVLRLLIEEIKSSFH